MQARTRWPAWVARLSLIPVVLFAAWLIVSEPPEQPRYILATATTGGTFYPVGVAIATLTKQITEPRYGVSLAAISSAGSEENLRLMRNGEAQFAILQGLYGVWAFSGSGKVNNSGSGQVDNSGSGQVDNSGSAGRLQAQAPFRDLRSVSALWPNVEHVLVRSDVLSSGTLDDLAGFQGRRFSVGARFSGTEGSNRHILRALGLDPDAHFDLVYQGYGASADAFQNKRIDGMNTPAGIPVGAVTRVMAAAGDRARLLDVTEAQRGLINQGLGDLWQPFVIPANTYPGQSQPVHTIAQSNLLAVTASVPDDHVYQLLVTLYDNLGFLQAFHSATRAMSLENAIKGLPVPLHPGAVRFYRERGLTIPAALDPASILNPGAEPDSDSDVDTRSAAPQELSHALDAGTH